MMKYILLSLGLMLTSFNVQALDNSVDKEVTVTGGSTIGTPLPPTCTGDKALQWDGNSWQCNVVSGSGLIKPVGRAYPIYSFLSGIGGWNATHHIVMYFDGLVPAGYKTPSLYKLRLRGRTVTPRYVHVPPSRAPLVASNATVINSSNYLILSFNHQQMSSILGRSSHIIWNRNLGRSLTFTNNGSLKDIYGKTVPGFQRAGF